METEKRNEAGLYTMKELFSQEVRNRMEGIKQISPDLWEMIVSFGFGDFYSKNTRSQP